MLPSPATAKPCRVLVADDHPLVREGVVALINRQPDMQVIAEATNGREALQLFLEHHPDVTLLDLRMPDMDGIEAVAAICANSADARTSSSLRTRAKRTSTVPCGPALGDIF